MKIMEIQNATNDSKTNEEAKRMSEKKKMNIECISILCSNCCCTQCTPIANHIHVLCVLCLSMQYPLCGDKYQNAMRDLQRVRVQVRDQIINYLAMFLCMDSL